MLQEIAGKEAYRKALFNLKHRKEMPDRDDTTGTLFQQLNAKFEEMLDTFKPFKVGKINPDALDERFQVTKSRYLSGEESLGFNDRITPDMTTKDVT